MEWIAAFIAAFLFLGWFGNHTAAKYRRLYGRLPEVLPDPPKRKVYDRREKFVSYDDACTAVGSYSPMMMETCSSVVSLSRPGSIIRLEKWGHD